MVELVLCAYYGRDLYDAWYLFLTPDDTLNRAHRSDQRDGRVWHYIRFLGRLHRGQRPEESSLIKAMTLLCDAPVPIVNGRIELVPHDNHDVQLVEKGKQLRAALHAYLEQRSASLIIHCPLPAVLQQVIATYAEPTRADVWESQLIKIFGELLQRASTQN
jgi:hypothetical protein